MTSENIALFTMIGAWLSGIATFLAVLVSLHIANRKPKVYVTGKVGYRLIVGRNERGENSKESGLSISVVNQSSVVVKIVSIHWEFGGDVVFHQLFGDVNSHELPSRIEYGEQAFFWIKFNDNDWMERFVTNLKESKGSLKKLKCAINLSTGKVFYIKPEKDFISKLNSFVEK